MEILKDYLGSTIFSVLYVIAIVNLRVVSLLLGITTTVKEQQHHHQEYHPKIDY